MKKLLFIVIVAVLGLTACGPSPEELVQQGKNHLENGDCEEAAKCFGKAVEKGNAEAMYEIGWMYIDSICINQDYEAAATWFKHAADFGYPYAQMDLAEMYNNGVGVPRDDEKAAYWAKKVLEQQENPRAQLLLGTLYYYGSGVPKDYEKAAELLVKLADNEEYKKKVAHYLYEMYFQGIGIPKDDEKAAEMYAIDNNVSMAEAYYKMGEEYFWNFDMDSGEIIDGDYPEALKWYLKAAELDHAKAQDRLAAMYYQGRGVDKNLAESRVWMKKAAANGNVKSQYSLGVSYVTGEGVPKDITEGKYWLQKAADQGYEKAREALEALEKVEKAQRFVNKTFTVNGVSFEMIAVKGGTFTMGCTSEQGGDCFNDEKPAHKVTLSNYYIGKFEVTQKLWMSVMGSNPSNSKGDNLPVENVGWNDIQEFITKLNQKTGANFRLPTEAEWEYAARGGNKSCGYKYSGSNTIGDVAWYTDNSGFKRHQVGTKLPNELGIYDMSGNVWEWCQDWYGSYSSVSQTNPAGYSSDHYARVRRGGSCDNLTVACRVSNRFSYSPGYTSHDLGFRLAMSY